MAILVIKQIDRDGNINVSTDEDSAAVGGDEFVNTGREFLYVDNRGGGPCAVTIASPRTVDGLAVAELVFNASPSEAYFLGPFPVGTFNDGDDKVQITYDQVTDVFVLVGKLL